MEQYIPKSALMAEFNRLIAELVEEGEDTMFEQGRISAFEDAKLFLDTLEMKWVDLEKEIQTYKENHSYMSEYIRDVAKHFFKLGMRINNPITAADRGTAEEIIINLKRVEQDYHIDLTKEMEWVRNQVKKGD